MFLFWAILLLGILIFVHELGHFLVAKLTGVKVLAFALGFGPKLLGVRVGDTEYKICVFPLGGYVRLMGHDPSDPIPPVIRALNPDKDAYIAGLRGGDRLVSLDNIEVESAAHFRDEWLTGRNPTPRLVVERAGQRLEFTLPRLHEEPPEDLEPDSEQPGLRLPDLGMDIGPDPAELERAFFTKPLWSRFWVVAAGPIASLLFPVLIYFVYFLSVDELTSSRIGQVIADTPAATAGLRPGDRILSVDGKPTPYWADMSEIVRDRPGETLSLEVEREDQRLSLKIVPEAGETVNMLGERVKSGRLGIVSTTIPAIIGTGGEESPAHKAGLRLGDTIVSVNSQDLHYIWQLEDMLEEIQVSGRPFAVEYERATEDGGSERRVGMIVPEPDPSGEGFTTGLYSADTFVGELRPDTPAALAGIQTGDRVVSVNGRAVSAWLTLTQALRESVSRQDGQTQIAPVRLVLARGTERLELEVLQTEEIVKGEFQEEVPRYHFGAYSAVRPARWLEGEYIPVENRLAFASLGAVKTSWEITTMTLEVFGKLVTGQLSFKLLGGPIMIFDVAGKAAERGWQYYIWVMALISINLGILNLLPVPVLDGGHLMFFTIEAIIRRPVNQRIKEKATMVGFIMLMMLMVFVMKNDIERYWDVIFG